MAQVIKKTPGRPRKDGSPARPRQKDPATGRFVKDKTKPAPVVSPVSTKPAPLGLDLTTDNGPTESTEFTGQGPQAAAEAVRAALGGQPGQAQASTGTAPAIGPESFDCDFKIVLQIINTILRETKPAIAMTTGEETAIGKALDAVIAKHWPDLKTVGPEVALGIALASWLGRIIFSGGLFSFNGLNRSEPTTGPAAEPTTGPAAEPAWIIPGVPL